MLAIALGLGLALLYLTGRDAPRIVDWICAALSLAICGYIAYRYDAITYEIALLPADLVTGAAILIALVLEATRRGAGGVLVGIILVISAYVFIGPHMPGDFATKPVSLPRLIVYLGLDTNGMIGVILSVALADRGAVHADGTGARPHRGRRLFRRSGDVGDGPLPRRRRQDRGVRLGAVRHDFRRRGEQRGGGRHRHHSADVTLGIFARPAPPRSKRSARPAGS